jgi:energy-coupling factor transporter transmembrane protein EcfT
MTEINKARVKLLILLVLSTGIVYVKSSVVMGGVFLMMLVMLLAKNGMEKVRKRLKPLLGIGIFVILFHLLFESGLPIETRLINGILAALKINVLSLVVFWYTSTTSVSAIAQSLSFLPGNLVFMLTVTLSLIPAIFLESEKIVMAQSSRGYDKKSMNIFKRLFPVAIPLLHRTLTRAQNLALVLESRGFES